MKQSLTILEQHYQQLLSAVFSKSGVEGAAYLLCGKSRTDLEERLLVREVIPVKDEHYLKRTDVQLSICSDSYVPVAKKAKDLNQSIIFAHSHPQNFQNFSAQDDREEPRLMEFFGSRVPDCTHGAIVISAPESVAGRVTVGNECQIMERVRVIGRRFRFFDAVSNEDLPLPNFFDDSNVNRVYGSGVAQKGETKINIASESITRIGLGTFVRKFPDGISSEESAKALRDCDVVFGCTDKQAPRGILTQLSLRYLIPFFDMGAKIESKNGVINGIFGRVTTFFPGEACLFCRGRIDAETIRLEGLSKDERAALAAEGYAPELDTNAPSVIMFTTAVATQAACEFLHRLTGFMGADRRTTEALFKFHEASLGKNRELPNENCVCMQKKLWGRGDSRSFLDVTWPAERNGK